MSAAKGIQYIVKERMKVLGLSVADMESKAGVGRNVLGNFLSGTRDNPTLDTLTRIAEVLECNIADLFSPLSDENQKNKSTELLKWNESLFTNCVHCVIKVINQQREENTNTKGKILDTNKIIFIIEQVYKFTLKDNPKTSIANEKFAEFLIENNFPSL